jgi:hypothetical protein
MARRNDEANLGSHNKKHENSITHRQKKCRFKSNGCASEKKEQPYKQKISKISTIPVVI